MSAWILIVAFASVAGKHDDMASQSVAKSYHVTMQEFGDKQSCQHASVEAQKVAPGIRVVCVPKGGK